MTNINRNMKYLLTGIFVLIFSGSLLASDGLQLKSESKNLTIYLKPNVNFKSYQSLNIEEVSIAFEEDWLRDYNHDNKGLSNRLNKKDIERIKKRFAKQFHKTFDSKLDSSNGYKVVQTNEAGTLLLKPSIIDMELNGPDKLGASFKVTMVHSAGKATLSLDIIDANSGVLLGRIIEQKKSREYHEFQRANLIFNKSEFIPIFNSWAKRLIKVI